jgi:hypothetical protein
VLRGITVQDVSYEDVENDLQELKEEIIEKCSVVKEARFFRETRVSKEASAFRRYCYPHEIPFYKFFWCCCSSDKLPYQSTS